jgi:hypothetical protein
MQHCTQQIFEDLLTLPSGTLNQERKIISHQSKITPRPTARKDHVSSGNGGPETRKREVRSGTVTAVDCCTLL